MRSDNVHLVDNFCEDWVCHLYRDNRVSLGLFLCFQLTKQFQLGEINAAELAGMMIGKSEREIREWRELTSMSMERFQRVSRESINDWEFFG